MGLRPLGRWSPSCRREWAGEEPVRPRAPVGCPPPRSPWSGDRLDRLHQGLPRWFSCLPFLSCGIRTSAASGNLCLVGLPMKGIPNPLLVSHRLASISCKRSRDHAQNHPQPGRFATLYHDCRGTDPGAIAAGPAIPVSGDQPGHSDPGRQFDRRRSSAGRRAALSRHDGSGATGRGPCYV